MTTEPGTPRQIPRSIPPGPYTPGQSYFGQNQYIEYIAGNSPVILSAPHGGDLIPSEISDRTTGLCGGTATTGKDLNTRELTLAIQQSFHARFGKYPHVVINRLHRKKLDANRDILEAACGDPGAQTAWKEFHAFLDVAKGAVLKDTGKGWYMDMHGHGHSIQRLELGYRLSPSQLDLADAVLDGNRAYEDTSSIKTMSEGDTRRSFSALLRGSTSLGTLYANNGFPSIPSASDPGPKGEPYFRGGYNSARHSCGVEATGLGGTSGGKICGVQIEANYTGVRDTPANINKFADVTTRVLDSYLSTHWGISLSGSAAQSATRMLTSNPLLPRRWSPQERF
ncbi:MAG: hypothetical protein M3497_06465, partial [Gemmatimonadota bacterium]|nr:hypothetical protein [Gemmatimonadota bacterium]